MTTENRITVADGKYTVVLRYDGNHQALRYGEPWSAYSDGINNLEAALAREVLQLQNQANLLADVLGRAIMAAGIVRQDIARLSGPELLMFGEDLVKSLTKQPPHCNMCGAPLEQKGEKLVCSQNCREEN